MNAKEQRVVEAAKYAAAAYWLDGLSELDRAVKDLLTEEAHAHDEDAHPSSTPSEPDAVSVDDNSAESLPAENLSAASGTSMKDQWGYKFDIGDPVALAYPAGRFGAGTYGIVTGFEPNTSLVFVELPDGRDWGLEEAHLQPVSPSEDPVEAAIADISEINRKKRADYTSGTDPFQNFREVAAATNQSVDQVFNTMIAVKDARLRSLAANNREPQNESVLDSLLDRAVYATLAYAYAKENQQWTTLS